MLKLAPQKCMFGHISSQRQTKPIVLTNKRKSFKDFNVILQSILGFREELK